jgi:hypothetical protein
LKKLAHAQNPDHAAMQPAARFVRLLRDALASGRCHITARSGGEPTHKLAVACGWKQQTSQKNVSTRPDEDVIQFWISSGPTIGWIEGAKSQDLFLNPSESLAVVQKLAQDTKQPFVIGERDLHQHLFEDDLLIMDVQGESEKESRGTLTVRKRRFGARPSVLHLRTFKILGLDDDDEDHPQP